MYYILCVLLFICSAVLLFLLSLSLDCRGRWPHLFLFHSRGQRLFFSSTVVDSGCRRRPVTFVFFIERAAPMPPTPGRAGGPGAEFTDVFLNFGLLIILWKNYFSSAIHPVQSVINNPTQLSGRGFPHIFYMELVLSQLYVFWVLKMEVGPCNLRGQYIKRGLAGR